MTRFSSHALCWALASTFTGLFGAREANAAVFPACDDFEARTFEDPLINIPYRVYIPPGYDAGQMYPMVVNLHGAGERGTDNCNQLANPGFMEFVSDVAEPKYHAFMLAPQCAGDQQWVDTPWAEGSYTLGEVPLSKSMTVVLKIIAALEEEFTIDPDRLYVTGLSMGGFGSWDAIMRDPTMWAAAVPMSGSGDPASAELIKNVPFWNFHGATDGLVPTQSSRDMVDAARGFGSPGIYTEYAGGHDSWSQNYATSCLVDWLFRQNRTLAADNGGVTEDGVCPVAGLDPEGTRTPRDGVPQGGTGGTGGTSGGTTGAGGSSAVGGTGGSAGTTSAMGGMPTTSAGSGGTTAVSAGGSTTTPPKGKNAEDGGCQLSSHSGNAPWAWSFVALALAGARLRRGRKHLS